MERATLLIITISLFFQGCAGIVSHNTNRQLWDIAHQNGKDHVFAVRIGEDIKQCVWISEEINPTGKKDLSVFLEWRWGSEEKDPQTVIRSHTPEKYVSYAHHRAIKKGEKLLGKEAHIIDVRRYRNNISDTIHVLMGTPPLQKK